MGIWGLDIEVSRDRTLGRVTGTGVGEDREC